MAFDITIYTDGAAKGNPGNGGFGTVLTYGKYKKEISEGFAHTTNNRMELLAVIAGLEAITANQANVTIYSDSEYVVNAVEKGWLLKWEKNEFKKRKNSDLWKRFLDVYKKFNVNFIWIKGHSGNKMNEYCDKLAVEASLKQNLKTDTGYIENIETQIEI